MDQEQQVIVREVTQVPGVSCVGDLYRFLVVGAETGGRFALWHASIPPGGGPPPHIHHREVELFFILRGELTFYEIDAGKTHTGGPGTAVYLPKDRPHRFANEGSEVAETLILAAPSGIENFFQEFGTPSSVAQPPAPQEIEKLLAVAPAYGIELLP